MARASMKAARAFAVIGLAAVVQAACAVGPNYKPPQVTVPSGWTGVPAAPGGGASVATPGPASVAEWWKVFNDPTLEKLISEAVKANLGLQQARARILQARAVRMGAGAGLWPTVTASASDTESGSTAATIGGSTTGPTTGSGTTRRNLAQVGLDAAWELDFFGGVRRGIEAAGANVQAAVEDARDVMVTLTAEVVFDYVALRGLQQQIAIANQNLEAQRQTASVTRRRQSVGFVSGLDVANAEAQVATTQSQIPLLEAAAQQEIYTLSVLVGREPTALLPELSAAAPIPPTPPAVPVGLPSELLLRRPDIRRADAQLHAATANIGVAKADLFPKISLTGSVGAERVTQGSLAALAGTFWSIVPGLTQPIFEGGRIRANIKVQEAVEQQALLAYRQSVLTALQDVESALISYEKDQQHRAALADAVKANRVAVDLSTRQYVAGETEFLNLLTAEHNLYTSEDALVQADRAIATDLIALYKALGGGWRPDAAPVAPTAPLAKGDPR